MQNISSIPFIKTRQSFILAVACFFAASLLPVCLNGQSLWDTAQKLDSLYKKINVPKGVAVDAEATKTFFEELEKLYRLDNSLDAATIKRDFAANRFLTEEVEYAFFQLEKNDAMVVDSIAKLEKQLKSWYETAIAFAENECKPKLVGQLEMQFQLPQTDSSGNVRNPVREAPKPCGIEEEIRRLKEERSLKNFSAVREKSESPELKRKFFEIQQEIFTIENEIKKLDEKSESILQFSAEAGGNIPFSQEGSPAASAISPIILQNQVSGGSISSSIIDGTSKWIAERMREELSIAFFDRFDNWVEGKNIRLLFPNTFSSLKSSVTTDYNLMIQIFKTAFEKDLKHMPFNLTNFLESEIAYKDSLAQFDENILQAIANINQLKRRAAKFEEMANDLGAQQYADTSQAAINFNAGLYDQLTATQIKYYEDVYNSLNTTYLEISDSIYTLYDQITTARLELQNNEMLGKEAYKALKYVLFTVKAIQILSEGEHPNTLLSHLNQNIDELFPQAGNVKPALLVMDVISRSLISDKKKDSKVWLEMNELYRLKSNRQLREFYFGLVYQEIRQTLRREKSQLESEINETVENEINFGTFGYTPGGVDFDASAHAEEATYGYNEDGTYGLRPLDSLLSSGMLDTMLNFNTKSVLLAKLWPMYNKANELDSLSISELNRVFKALEEAIVRFNNTPEVAAYLKQNPNTPADTVLNAIGPDISNIPLNVIYAIEEGETLLPEDFTNLTEQQINAMVDKSNKLLKEQLDQKTILVQNENKSIMLGAMSDYMRINLNYYINENKKIILEDSIYQLFRAAFMVKAKQDSMDVVAQGIEKSAVIQRLYLQLGRLDNYQAFIDTLLLGNTRNFGDIVNGFVQFANRMDDINAEFKNLKKMGKANLGTHEFIYLMKNSLEALHNIYEIALPNDPATLSTIKGLSSNLLDAYAAVLEKDYDAVVMNIIPVADSLLELSYHRKVNELKQLKASSDLQNQTKQDTILNEILDNDNGYATKKGMDKKLKKKLRKLFKEPQSKQVGNEWEVKLNALLAEKETKVRKMHEIYKYGAFLAAVVQSQNSDEIKNAIRAVALPAGSYSIKRRSYRNISLNAYPGITGGMELATNKTGHELAPNFGFTAPIGLAVSWGYRSRINGLKYYTKPGYRRRVDNSERLPGNHFRSGQSGSLFFPLIDLGAVVLFRLDDSNESLPEDIGFQQIFSPGIMYAHGLPDLPISIMGGFQVSPQLRKIGEEKANAFRFNVSLVVDLPMANLHTRARQK
jgi:hypothetical protein